jgi:hypothetical protein
MILLRFDVVWNVVFSHWNLEFFSLMRIAMGAVWSSLGALYKAGGLPIKARKSDKSMKKGGLR